VIYNLDSNQRDVYGESNLIEARAAAILTPHLMRHAPAVFLKSFPVSSHIFMIRSGQNNCVLDTLREQVFLIWKQTGAEIPRLSFRAKRGIWVFAGREKNQDPSLRFGMTETSGDDV
jgi:hypothetical protein